MAKLPKFTEEYQLAQSLKTPFALEKYEKLQIGDRIKQLRKKADMTQESLSKRLNTSQSVVARIELGRQNLTIRTLIQISIIFGKKLKIQVS